MPIEASILSRLAASHEHLPPVGQEVAVAEVTIVVSYLNGNEMQLEKFIESKSIIW